jgi:hypothetical protein
VKKAIIFVMLAILNAGLYAAVSGPYTVDAYTLHLYHFDGNANDEVTTNTVNLTLRYGATVTETSYADFGTAINTYEGTWDTASNMPIAYNSEEAVNKFVGADGAFTFEAIVKPAVAITAIPNNMQIISGEDDGSEVRAWQFRVTTTGQLEFTKLTGSTAVFSTALPSTGDHAWAAGQWFHAAVTYNGAAGTADNLKLYWTALDSGESEAVLLGSFQMAEDLDSTPAIDFAIGNESRDATGENFEGLLDEVRISSIVRAAGEMLFVSSVPRPVIIAHPSDTVVHQPQAASFQTIFESDSTPIVQWFKVDTAGDIELTSSDPDISIQTSYNSGTQQYTAALSISNTTTLDSGSYYCRINNDSGLPRNSNNAVLTVVGLIAHWTLDQADFVSGQYLEEINGYDAAAQGTPTFTAGADGTVNGAVQIASNSGWATVNLNPSTTGQMTVSVWAYWQQAGVSSDDVQVQSLPDESTVTAADGLKSNDHWQQVCAVFDGTTGKLYVDGKLRDQGACPLPADMTSLLDIGSAGSGSQSFNGALDDLRIYNYAMTDTEVADVYHIMSGLRVCLLEYASQFDYAGPTGQPDCTVDLYDLVLFANNWLVLYDYPEFADLSSNWLSCGLYPDCNP